MYSFYKAFVFPAKGPTTVFYTPGDIFSNSPEKAVRSVLERIYWDDINLHNVKVTLGHEVPRPNDVIDSNKPPFIESVMILCVTANNDNDVTENKNLSLSVMDKDLLDFSFHTTDLTSGRSLAIQEYSVVFVSALCMTNELVDPSKLSFALKIVGENYMEFPDEIVYPAECIN